MPTQDVVGDQDAEDGKRNNLEYNTSNHEAVANISHLLVIGGGGNATASRLQDKGEDVGGDETPGVEAWGNARPGGAEDEGDVLQDQVLWELVSCGI